MVLRSPTRSNPEPGPDGVAIALGSDQSDVQIVAEPNDWTIHLDGHRLRRVKAAGPQENMRPAVTSQIGNDGAVALTEPRHPRGERDVPESATVELKDNRRLAPNHLRSAVPEYQVEVPVVVQVGGVAAHRTPAFGDTEIAIDIRERPIAVVVVNAQGAVGRSNAVAQGLQHVFVTAPDILNEIQVTIAVVIAPERHGSEAGRVDSSLAADIREGTVAVVVKQLRAPERTAEEQIRKAIVVVVAPCRANCRPGRDDAGTL